MSYTIITENDTSSWNDKTGELYHFPKRYLKFLSQGPNVIYYKGRIKNIEYIDVRLTGEPHYFGIAKIGKVYLDVNSDKSDYFAEILDYVPFNIPVLAKTNNEYLEVIPKNRITNYWRDGVRLINENIYHHILELSEISTDKTVFLNDLSQGYPKAFETELVEGGKKVRYTSFYERNPKLRQQAIDIHGYTCLVCGFNFENTYGEKGKGYIHVHHIKPISESGRTKVNPKTDLVVLCANCHSIIHRYRNKLIPLEELRLMLGK